MARFPVGLFTIGATGCYKCARKNPSQGSCGIRPYPCTHYGLDLYPEEDLTVFAPEDGVVTDVGNGQKPPFTGYNPGAMLIKGVSGYYHLLSHLAEIKVVPGAQVTEGEPVGKIASAIKHTHYEVRRERTGNSATNTVDPGAWLRLNHGVQVAMVDIRGSTVWTTTPDIIRDIIELNPPAPHWRSILLTSLLFTGGLVTALHLIERRQSPAG